MFNVVIASHIAGRVPHDLNPFETSWVAYCIPAIWSRITRFAEKPDTFVLRANRKLRADVECIYNSSTEFAIVDETDSNFFPVVGSLPNSSESEEHSEHIGHRSKPIVAIGSLPMTPSQSVHLISQLAKTYAGLNATQCSVSFTPKFFNVSVSLSDHSINVNPVFQWGSNFASSTNPYPHTDSVI